jgi:GNAT superfamily N-acetyltransferase
MISSSITLQPVSSPTDLKAFIRFPWKIYRSSPYWVPPIIQRQEELFNPRKNPFYQHGQIELFLARSSGEAVGRIACILDSSNNEFHHEKTAAFGFFESVSDERVAHALLEHARQRGKAHGMELLRGPLSPSVHHECGLLVDGFDRRPSLSMPYNPPEYADWFERFGLKKAQDLLAYHLKKHSLDPIVRKVASRSERNHSIAVERMNLARFDENLRSIFSIYNAAWSGNWGFVPVSEKEFRYLAYEFKPLIDPDLALMAKVDGMPAGFALTFRDPSDVIKEINGSLFPFGFLKLLLADKRRWPIRTAILGVLPEFRHRGIEAILYLRGYDAWIKNNGGEAELSWILEDNRDMNQAIVKLGGIVSKRYRIYEMKL